VSPAYEDQLPHFDSDATAITYDLWHGYRKLDRDGATPAFPFGFGLTYTQFTYRSRVSTATRFPPTTRSRMSVEVENTGARDADEVVQIYAEAIDSAIERAPRELRGFARIAVPPARPARPDRARGPLARVLRRGARRLRRRADRLRPRRRAPRARRRAPRVRIRVRPTGEARWATTEGGSGSGIDRAPRSEDFQRLVETVVDYAIFMLDPSGVVTTWNRGRSASRLSADEIIGRHFSAFYPAEDVAARKPSGSSSWRRAGKLEDEGWRVRSDGSLFGRTW
jgi:hypothetical protein